MFLKCIKERQKEIENSISSFLSDHFIIMLISFFFSLMGKANKNFPSKVPRFESIRSSSVLPLIFFAVIFHSSVLFFHNWFLSVSNDTDRKKITDIFHSPDFLLFSISFLSFILSLFSSSLVHSLFHPLFLSLIQWIFSVPISVPIPISLARNLIW